MSLGQKLSVLASGATLPRRVNERTPADVGLAFERQVFSTRDGPALEGWYVPRSEARGTVLMFHGYADRKAALLDAARAFHELGYASLLVDFRGSGGSSGDTTSIGYFEAEDVLAALAHATQRGAPRPLLLFGASMGAAAVLRAIGELGADSAALVLQYPFSRMSVTVARRFEAMGLPAYPAAPLLVFWGGVQLGFNGFRHNPVDYARSVRTPTLLMQGDRDDRVSLREAQQIFEALAGPKQLRIFHGMGHQSLVAAQPEAWRQAVSDFLR
jgi:alpha-beta hydrolase superfamily lysophospholipase